MSEGPSCRVVLVSTVVRLVDLIESLAVRFTCVLLVVRAITMCFSFARTGPIFDAWFLDNCDIVLGGRS